MKLGRIIFACMLAIGGASLATASEPQKEPVAKKETVLTGESLGVILENMGLSPKQGKYTSGKPYYDVVIKQDNYETPVCVALSPNEKVVWLHVYLGDLPPMDQVPAEVLINLMKKSGSTVGRAMFCVRSEKLYMLQSFDNIAITPAKLLNQFQDLGNSVKGSEKDWTTKDWKTAKPTTEAVKTTKVVE